MDYIDLLKQAWQIIKKYKFLWIFGLFMGGTSFSGGSSGFDFNGKSSSKIGQHDFSQTIDKTGDFITSNSIIITIIFLLIIFLILVAVFLKIASEGAIIAGVNDIENKKKTNFSSSFKLGLKYFWKILAFDFILGVIIFFSVIILGVPVVFLFILGMPLRGLALLLLALVIFIPLAIIIGFVSIYSPRFIVIKDGGILSSIKLGFNLFRNNLGPSFIVYFILLAINMAITIISLIAILILALLIGIPAVIIGIMIYPLTGMIGVILLIVFGLLLFMAIFLFIGAILNAYKSTLWTLAFKELAE